MERTQYFANRNQDKYGIEGWWPSNMDEKTSSQWIEFMRSVPQARISWIEPFAGPDGKRRASDGRRQRQAFAVIFSSGKYPEHCVRLLDHLATDF